jgi:cytoskeletal protein CcmA (bactofilin family)
MCSEGSVRIEGSLIGKMEAKGKVIVGNHGNVQADIRADSVVAAGHIVGNVNAHSRLEIAATGRVIGDVETPAICFDRGGELDGFCRMVQGSEAQMHAEPRLAIDTYNCFGSHPTSEYPDRRSAARTVHAHHRILFSPLAFFVSLVLVFTLFLGWRHVQNRWQGEQAGEHLSRTATAPVESEELHEQERPAQSPTMEFVLAAPAGKSNSREQGTGSRAPAASRGKGAIFPAIESPSASGAGYAHIENPKMKRLEGGEGFRFRFKLVNPTEGEPIAGTVAVIAALKEPHWPRFVSFPHMKLDDRGMPVELKRPLTYRIRRFKYVSAEFDFPFSHTEAFRILVYNHRDRLVNHVVVPVDEVS